MPQFRGPFSLVGCLDDGREVEGLARMKAEGAARTSEAHLQHPIMNVIGSQEAKE